MRDTTWLAGIAALALSLGAPSGMRAQERYDDKVITGASLSDTVCNLGNARKVSLEQALRYARSAGDECFAIDGFWHADGLFISLADARMTWSNLEPALSDRRLGVYGAKRLMAASRGFGRYTLVGRLRDCDTAWPGAAFVAGYCHHTGGLFVIISQIVKRRR